jgi:hypothetical protein
MSTARFLKTQKMLPSNAVGTANILECENPYVDKRLKERLPIISCECGTEILVVPDLQAMNRAIKTHVAEHRKRERTAKKSAVRSSKISQLLSQLTLIKMSEENGTS